MDREELAQLMMSYQKSIHYPSYKQGICAKGGDFSQCRVKNPVECRKCRQGL